jgi:hypothetical protein
MTIAASIRVWFGHIWRSSYVVCVPECADVARADRWCPVAPSDSYERRVGDIAMEAQLDQAGSAAENFRPTD